MGTASLREEPCKPLVGQSGPRGSLIFIGGNYNYKSSGGDRYL